MKRADSRTVTRIVLPFVVGAAGVALALAAGPGMSSQLLNLGIQVAIFSVAILGLGIVTGSAGMIALCQLSFAAVGAWVVSGLNYLQMGGDPSGDHASGVIVVVWLALGGLAAAVVGILVGLPALRLRGVNLAVVTLGFAVAVAFALVQIQFPGVSNGVSVTRPTPPYDDKAFFVFSVAVLAVCAIVVYFVQGGRWGSSWKAVAFSERGTASVGASVSQSKLTAFAVSAGLGGIGGGLLVMQSGQTLASGYTPLNSLALYVLAIIAGAHFIDMAIFGGILWVAVPPLLEAFDIPKDWAFVIFGALSVQALTSGATLGGGIRNLWWKRLAKKQAAQAEAHLDAGTAPEEQAPATPEKGEPLLVTRGLTVQFGQVKALDSVDVTVHERAIMGLIGPNGAGKSTFVDAITGFLPRHTGEISIAGRDLGRASPTKRARLGLRRTFQQDRVPPSLTVEAYARFVARRKVSTEEIAEALSFFGCPPPRTRLVSVDVGTRRLIEIAANVLAKPRILLLDEPAAGLSHEEHVELGRRIRQTPERFGTAVVLIEHDLEMVRSVCDELTVLNFGEVIASGPQKDVLENPEVMKAYMGETEML